MSTWNRHELEKRGYKINDRTTVDIYPIWRHHRKWGLPLPEFREKEVIYTGAEHTLNPKLPNQTLIPDIYFKEGIILGSTFGHQHEGDLSMPFQEIYEFESHGGVLLRRNSDVKLVLAYPSDKIIVRPDENMTLYNFGEGALLTRDYANPSLNNANKDLEKEIGSLMAVWRFGNEFIFKLNLDYRGACLLEGIENEVIIKSPTGGDLLYEKMKENSKEFEKAGIELLFGGNLPEKYKTEFEKPLEQLATEKNKLLYEILRMPK